MGVVAIGELKRGLGHVRQEIVTMACQRALSRVSYGQMESIVLSGRNCIPHSASREVRNRIP